MRKLLLILLLVKSVSAHAEPKTIVLDKKRTINIIGTVDSGMVDKAKQLEKLSKQSKKDVFLLINSPGGSVAFGELFVSAMGIAKARGVKIKCVVPVYAASMAFSIMLNCSENYVLPNAQLLFHPVRVGMMGYLTGLDAQEIAKHLLGMDRKLLEVLYEKFGAETNAHKELINYHFVKETWWSATDLIDFILNKSLLTVVDNIEGSDNLFELLSPVDAEDSIEQEKIIYIAPTLPKEGVR